MQTRSISIGPGVEIACDESGFSGRNLVRSDTPVFAHASVRLRTGSAARLIRDVRDRSHAPVPEYKSGQLLREKDRSLLEWFLGPSGPLYGNAHVHLTDKAFFVVCRAVQLLVGELPAGDVDASLGLGLSPDRYARGLAVTLHREGPTAFGHRRWQAFLEAANDLVNGGRALDRPALVDAFFGVLDELDASGFERPAGQVVQVLRRSGAREQPRRLRLLGDPRLVPALDPFVPAIVAAVRHWSERVGPVVIVHDEQSVLNRRRIAQLYQILHRPGSGDDRAGTTTLMSGLRGADSRGDPRVQVADLLAGLARRIASDSLVGNADPGLATLLRPYLDEHSVWADDHSWCCSLGQGWCDRRTR